MINNKLNEKYADSLAISVTISKKFNTLRYPIPCKSHTLSFRQNFLYKPMLACFWFSTDKVHQLICVSILLTQRYIVQIGVQILLQSIRKLQIAQTRWFYLQSRSQPLRRGCAEKQESSRQQGSAVCIYIQIRCAWVSRNRF